MTEQRITGTADGMHAHSEQQQPPVRPAVTTDAVTRRGMGWRMGAVGGVAAVLLGTGAGAGVSTLLIHHADTSGAGGSAQSVVLKNPAEATSATAAAATAAPSVVTIYAAAGSTGGQAGMPGAGSQAAGTGSGVILSADGFVLTNNHVVTLDSSTTTADLQVRTADGTLFDATVVGRDPTSDLAVVKMAGAGGLTPATFADSAKVQVGDQAVAIGAPLGLSGSITDGIISDTSRAVVTAGGATPTVIDALQTDAAINPGNSGGALVDASGAVIGINSAIASVAAQQASMGQPSQSGNIGVGFAIPSDTAKRVADEIIATGSATHALLGVEVQTRPDTTEPQTGTGAQIVQVAPGGPAASAGLHAGDVIVGVNGEPVISSTDLTAYIQSAAPGAAVTLAVGHGHTVQVTLGTAGA